MNLRRIAAFSLAVAGSVTANMAAIAATNVTNNSRPFEYHTKCALINNGVYEDTCKVVETRESSGKLKSRNIFSNKFSLSIKSWFDPEGKFVTWDSHNKREFLWDYKNSFIDGKPYTAVTEWFYLDQVSWD